MPEFEWDPEKAATNLAKHGVSFEEATLAFDDPAAIEWSDESQNDEERFLLCGASPRRLLLVVYTERGDRYRLISARGADRYERAFYRRQEAP